MDVSLFDFSLPEALIALRPAPRGTSRLMEVTEHGIDDRNIADLIDIFQAGDRLVFNDTRVFPARLYGRRGEASVEVTLHLRKGITQWEVFAKPAKRLREGDRVEFGALTAQVIAVGAAGARTLDFQVQEHEVMAAISAAGTMPLPPYIASKRAVDARDTDDYQTVYADKEGAVAAPTAGLHFTGELLAALAAKGVEQSKITLHVGAGTFLPVKVDDTDDHDMHAEWGEISPDVAADITQTMQSGGRLIAVGTTSLRLLESAVDGKGGIQAFSGETDIFITPGYRIQTADMLMTNFHLPKSTLMMLISAFSGRKRMMAAYQHAIAEQYRFYSYGDSCLLHRCMDIA